MAKNITVSKNPSTFVTNDWRQLSANAAESFLSKSEDMTLFDEKNGMSNDVGSNVGIGSMRSIVQEISLLKQDNHHTKAIVFDLEKDRDNLRTAIRKLKVENVRMKSKLKRLGDAVKIHSGLGDNMETDNVDEEVDYEDLRQFLLVGGPKDPFALQFHESSIQDIKDTTRTEHKSCERYYWYKMAQYFEDNEAMQKILNAEDSRQAEEILKDVKTFDQAKWDAVKTKYWEDAQRLKFEQHRWIRNLLIKTGSTYIAVASQDKTIGTGWRKQREEASRTQLWDGENAGGKILMKLREEFTLNHSWATPQEEQDALQKFNDFKRTIWKPYNTGLRKVRGAPVNVRRGVERMSVAAQQMFPPPQQSVAARFGTKVLPKKRRQI